MPITVPTRTGNEANIVNKWNVAKLTGFTENQSHSYVMANFDVQGIRCTKIFASPIDLTELNDFRSALGLSPVTDLARVTLPQPGESLGEWPVDVEVLVAQKGKFFNATNYRILNAGKNAVQDDSGLPF